MNIKKILLCLLLCTLLLLSACYAGGNYSETSFFSEVILSSKSVSVAGLTGGMSCDEVLKVEGLSEADIEISDAGDRSSSPVIYVTSKGWLYDEAAPYTAMKIYTFTDDKLTAVEYGFPFWDVAYNEAFPIAMGLFEEVEKLAGRAETLEEWDRDSLDMPGGRYQKKFMLGKTPVAAMIHYQDMSEADFTDMDLVSFSLRIPM